MSWTETHRYYQALRVVEAELDRSADGLPAWRPEYCPVFGSPAGLRLALSRRWLMLVEVQVDTVYSDGRPSRQLRDLAAAHHGLLLAVVRDDPRWLGLVVRDDALVSAA